MRNFSTRSFFVLLILVAMAQAAVNAQQPRIRFNLPAGGFQEVCLQQAAATVDVVDDSDILITANAASNDLGCPGSDPIINSLSASPMALDLTTLNCDLDDDLVDDAVCLFVSWNITPAISDTTCDVEQIEPVAKFSQIPFEFTNPSSFVDPQNPTVFAEVVNGLEWQVNLGTATAGLKRFRMTCTAVGGGGPVIGFFESTYVDGADPTVTIDTFNITEDMADQGEMISFSWNVTLNNNPSAPTCTLSSPGTINSVTVAVTGAPGSATATILGNSPLGVRNFTFSCRPDAAAAVTDTANDTVTVNENMVMCPPPIVPTRDTTFTTYEAVFGLPWPGPNQDPFNIAVDTNEYMALQFTVPATGITGDITTVQAPVPNIAGLIASLSPCPGVLETPDNPFCDVDFPGVKTGLGWSHSTAPNPSGCVLEAGETYFYNIFFGDRNGSPTCTFNECVGRFSNRF